MLRICTEIGTPRPFVNTQGALYKMEKNNMMKIARLGIKQYEELKRLSELKDFPFEINRKTVFKTCHGKAFRRMCKPNTIHNKMKQMYGCFDGDSLVGVVCVKFEFVSPVGSDEPMHKQGWNCELTEAYTVLGYRKHGICTALTSAVKNDAQTIGANIFCPIFADDKDMMKVKTLERWLEKCM